MRRTRKRRMVYRENTGKDERKRKESEYERLDVSTNEWVITNSKNEKKEK